MQLFVTYIVLFVTAVKARFSDFNFFHCGPYLCLKHIKSRVKGLELEQESEAE